MRHLIAACLLAVGTGLLPGLATAEVELSFYGGWQNAPHSDVTIRGDSAIADSDFVAGWEGQPFNAPPYYGLRATWWQNERFGFGVELTHDKVYADATTLAVSGLERFEFSDGLNILTVNAFRRWEDSVAGFTPYVGGGVGVAIPHVEVFDGRSRTFEYQLTGPAVAWMAGASYPITDSFSVFGEYKGTYSMNSATLDGGGTLETDILTNALNLGVSFNF